MPLPTEPNTPWLPKGWADVYTKYWEYSTWYAGDPSGLSNFYRSNLSGPVPLGRHWAKDPSEAKRAMVHVPIAGDIAALNADLLFSEAPKFIIPKAHEKNPGSDAKYAQERLEEIIEEGGVVNRLLEGAESGAALGGVFIKPVWDQDLAPYPILSVAQADAAIPEFRFGFLTAVTFWKEDEVEKDVFFRWLERHEDGVILNGLYKGDRDKLGHKVPLDSHPMTAGLEEEVKTLLKGLAVEYVPNMKPNRLFRGSSLGKSDFAGTEGLMDALDETYSSWLRDIRLAQGRIIVPEEWLEEDPNKHGRKIFDVDREIFTTVNADPLSASQSGSSMTVAQFAIRTEEHRDTTLELLDRIIGTAGYSPQSFGLKIEGRAESGTALNIRERRSFATKAKKERYWKPSIQRILKLMLLVDRLHLRNTRLKEEILDVAMEFQDSINTDIGAMAQAVELVNRAEAASIETKVRMLHNDWTEDQIAKEVAAIMSERSINVPNPEETDEFMED